MIYAKIYLRHNTAQLTHAHFEKLSCIYSNRGISHQHNRYLAFESQICRRSVIQYAKQTNIQRHKGNIRQSKMPLIAYKGISTKIANSNNNTVCAQINMTARHTHTHTRAPTSHEWKRRKRNVLISIFLFLCNVFIFLGENSKKSLSFRIKMCFISQNIFFSVSFRIG